MARRGQARRRGRRVAVLIAAASVVAACSGDDDTTVTSSTSPDTTVASVGAADDDRLTVGVLLPLTGEGSELGTVLRDAVVFAADEIDDAGGVGSSPDGDTSVRLVEIDESSLEDGVPSSVEDIFNEPVDAIIGPASSLLAERLLPVTVRAGVITCSPTANAMSLDDFPDPGPLFVRTIPSDELQARALARQLDGTGGRIVLVHVDDAYGQRFAAAVRSELSRGGAPVTEVVDFDPADTDYSDEALRIVASGAPTIGIIGDPEDGPRLLQALTEQLDPEVQTAVYMNDAMRVPTTSGVYRRLDPRMLAMMRGVSPSSSIADETLAARFPADGQFFAANGYDCMNVLALAAREAGSISGAAMASQVVAVTNGGTSCADVESCTAASATGRNIDYDGPTGSLDIGRGGDPVVGLFDVYAFDPDSGLDVTLANAPIVVSSD